MSIHISQNTDGYISPPPLKSSLVKNGRYEEFSQSFESFHMPPTNSQNVISRIQEKDDELMSSLQLGVKSMLSKSSNIDRVNRDLLMMDFSNKESQDFPKEGTVDTLAHTYTHFSIKIYAPLAFECFRDMFGIQTEEFLASISSLQIFQKKRHGSHYQSDDTKCIVKRIHQNEKNLLLKILPAYYMNLTQNSKSLLPHFYGLYRYQNKQKRKSFFVIFNNVFQTDMKIQSKYKLRGSKTNKICNALLKPSEFYLNDSEFMKHHPKGLFVIPKIRRTLLKTIRRDCLVLQSINVVGYSLVFGLHTMEAKHSDQYQYYINKSINIIPARTYAKEEVLLFVGFDDVLQPNCFKNKFKVAVNELLHQTTENIFLSPALYADKFRKYIANEIIQKDVCCVLFKNINYPENIEENAKTSGLAATVSHDQSFLPVPVPKFGEKLSPCNVSDWLQLHEAFNIMKVPNKQLATAAHLDRARVNRRVSFKYLSKFEERNDHFDFATTQSVMSMSMQGSMFRNFQPLSVSSKDNLRINRNANKVHSRTKREYFEYVDYVYAIGENNSHEDNIVLSLYSIFEAKKEMMRRPTVRACHYVTEIDDKESIPNINISPLQESQQSDKEFTTVDINLPEINICQDF